MYQVQVPEYPVIELEKVFPVKKAEVVLVVKTPENTLPDSFSPQVKEYAEIAGILLMLLLIILAFVTVIYGATEIANFFVEMNQNQFFESVYGMGPDGFLE